MDNEFKITFPGATDAQANQYAGELRSVLRETDRHIQVEQARTRPDSQDFGATLVIVLGTASVTAIAKGIQSWLTRNSGASIEISKDGHVVAKNLDSKDAAKLAEAAFKAVSTT